MGRLLFIAIVAFIAGGTAQAQRAYDVDILAETFGFDDSTRKTGSEHGGALATLY